MKILITGGLGYIGSHTAIALLEAGYQVVIIDNLTNSKAQVQQVIEKLSGCKVTCYHGDLRDKALLKQIFSEHDFTAVLHFAGYKAVAESVHKPQDYYDNNLISSIYLTQAMLEHQVNCLVFSSSATVYGTENKAPYLESYRTGNTSNPYGTTKYLIELYLQELTVAHPQLSITTLRYFNPIGAHSSGDLGEDPVGIPNNLAPYITQVAVGKLEKLQVYGDDYPTADGTCIRDYIHVVDLAEGHLAALKYKQQDPGFHIYNLGTGIGSSVLEVVAAFNKATGKAIPYVITQRRAGDLPFIYANVDKAKQELNWQTKKDLEQMAEDSWRWQSKNPNGI